MRDRSVQFVLINRSKRFEEEFVAKRLLTETFVSRKRRRGFDVESN